MDFENYKLNDFLMDDSFCNSVKNPNSDDGLFWDTWLSEHVDKKDEADQAKKIIKSISFSDRSFSKNEITELWKNIQQRTSKINKKKTVSINFRLWNYIRVAAVLLPFIATSVLFLIYRDSPEPKIMVQIPVIQKINPKGQKLTFFLSDGSKVRLNSESSISYLQTFDSTQRVVTLEGEAFFEVTPDSKRPFIVRTGEIETTVVGTSFNVEAYPAEEKVKVAVKTGKVSVNIPRPKTNDVSGETIVLSPMEMATYSRKTNKSMVSGYDPLTVLGWSEGTLHFENASMSEFILKLERWYGVDIIVKRDKPVPKGITGTYTQLPLEEILMGHRSASEFDYEFLPNGNVIIK